MLTDLLLENLYSMFLTRYDSDMSLVVRKPVFGVSDQVRHKPGCTATQDGMRLEIPDLGSGGIVLCSENKDADQLRGYREADLRLCFRIRKKPVFTRHGSYSMFLTRYDSDIENGVGR